MYLFSPQDLNIKKEKSRTMKFDFSKSTDADFRNKIQSDLGILMSNVLYITHELDHVKTLIIKLSTDMACQKQVDEFFDEDAEDIPEVVKETK